MVVLPSDSCGEGRVVSDSTGAKGFTQVDRAPDPAMFIESMDATARWRAVQRLRAWEAEHLRAGVGDAVLDVGCGTADVLNDLALRVGDTGCAVGLDASQEMLSVASGRARALGATVEFQVGDAQSLPFADASFDVVRSERTLQWVKDPLGAVAEMVRVLRPGGRICLTDTDWRTLLIDHPSTVLVGRLGTAMEALRGDQLSVGGRLVNMLRDNQVRPVDATAETHMWLEWNPDESIAPAGMVPLRLMAGELVAQNLMAAAEAETMVEQFEQTAREDRFFSSLTMFAAAGTKPV